MIRYLKNNEIDYGKWDDCIRRAYNGNVYAWSWYLDIVCEGWDALVMDNYEHVMPVTAGKKYGINYLYQPPFTQQLGVFSIEPSGSAIINEFLETLTSHFSFAEINLNSFNKTNHPKFSFALRRNYELDLIRPWEELRNHYTSNTSRNIRKAVNNGISIMGNADPKSIVAMFKAEKGMEIKKMGDSQYQMLHRLMYRSIYKKIAIFTGAYDQNNRLCAGVFLLRSHNRIVLLFSANNKTARRTGAMHKLIDWVIQKYAGQAITLDFEGSEIPGLARFYAGFGSFKTHYPALRYNRLPVHFRLAIGIMKLLHLK